MKNKNLLRSLSTLVLIALVVGSLSVFMPVSPAQATFGDRITVSGNQLMAGSNPIWINGANTPWNNWNDFGGNYNASWWDNHFQQLHANGVNAIRVWITCSGEVGINIDSNGVVSGATDKHWQDLDSFFQIAQQNQIYIMATLMSFDHFKNTYTTYTRWRNWINSDTNIDSYVTNYLIPFVNRYETNPYLWSIDLMNEPDWVHENPEEGQLPLARLQAYFARGARAIHENSPILVTVGMGMPKYMSTCSNGCEGNYIADSALQTFVNDPDVYIDFYSSHYYPWEDPYFGGIPFYQSPTSYFGSNPGKPALIGEEPATGSTGHTLAQDYENGYQNGWSGVMPWTSNGVDANGGFSELISATVPFLINHPSAVFPGVTPPPTSTITNTPTPCTTCAGTLKVQLASSGTDNTQQSAFNLKVMNTGTSAQSNLSLRIYFTLDGSNSASSYVLEKYYDQSGSATVSGPTLLSGSTYYYTVNFGSASLPAGGSWAYNTAMHLSSWGSTYSGTNDFWHTTGTLPSAFTDWSTIPLYMSGYLIWGGEPGGTGATNTPSVPTNTPTRTNTPSVPTNTPTRTNTPSVPTNTPTVTNTSSVPTNTPTRTNTPSVPTITPTPTATSGGGSGTCSPVNATITAPFTKDGAGTFCWQSSNLGSYTNNWNMTSLTINGVNFTNVYVGSGSYPAQIGGYWYVVYNGPYPWSHFEAK